MYLGHGLTHSSLVKAEPRSVIPGGYHLHTLLFALHTGKKRIAILPGALKMKAWEIYCKQISTKMGEEYDLESH